MSIDYTVTKTVGFYVPAERYDDQDDGVSGVFEEALESHPLLTFGESGSLNSVAEPGRSYVWVGAERLTQYASIKESNGFLWRADGELTEAEIESLNAVAEELEIHNPKFEVLFSMAVF
jgi:hypothetical protein